MKSKKTKRDQFTILPNIVFDLNLDPYDFFVYFQLFYLSGQDGEFSLSVDKLCKKIGISDNKLRRCVRNLENGSNSLNLKLVETFRNLNDDGSNAMTLYRILDLPSDGGF
jgi:hypothetical protein